MKETCSCNDPNCRVCHGTCGAPARQYFYAIERPNGTPRGYVDDDCGEPKPMCEDCGTVHLHEELDDESFRLEDCDGARIERDRENRIELRKMGVW